MIKIKIKKYNKTRYFKLMLKFKNIVLIAECLFQFLIILTVNNVNRINWLFHKIHKDCFKMIFDM